MKDSDKFIQLINKRDKTYEDIKNISKICKELGYEEEGKIYEEAKSKEKNNLKYIGLKYISFFNNAQKYGMPINVVNEK
ncbi:hypothetical protein [Clostridium sulfidigenes]|uniref:hypothetical protein n=1 Tax=Clostridium sulfidigenes TaxID=318464 RepID=UPI003F8B3D5F